MSDGRSPTLLCISSFEKGAELLEECHTLGCRTLLLTTEALADAAWPRHAIDDVFLMPDLYHRRDVVNGVSWLARTERIARIVALDEFDVEMAAVLREHLRVPGPGESHARIFRDKLAMRERARDRGLPVPEFVGALHHEDLQAFVRSVPAPWILKPRLSASAMGIRKLEREEDLWRALEELGDDASFHLLERFVEGDICHVDSLVFEGRVVFAEAHAYSRPPFAVYHGGGLFSSRTLERDSELSRSLLDLGERVAAAFELSEGALHTEVIRGAGGELFFLETAKRVGGASISDMVEASTGVNLWREWARLEVAAAGGPPYRAPEPRARYGGVLITLARQEWPDLSSYDDPEVALRLRKRHHAGVVLGSEDPARIQALLDAYARRFAEEFHTSLPAADQTPR